MNDPEHENWIRFHSFEEACKIMPGAITEDVITEAKKIESYVLGRRPATVLKLTGKKKR